MKKIILSFFLLVTFVSFSQVKKVTGKVTSATDGMPLTGASVKVAGGSMGASTDFDGGFTIAAENGATLTISSVGFKTKSVKVNSSTVNVSLLEDSESLKEVVVTGALGIKKSKASQGYATQTISGKEIADTQRANFINGLQGRVAGLQVTSTSGAPGASAAIQLRGVNSLSGSNSPLFIVDGLPISNETLSQGQLISDQPNRSQDYTNRAADINPEDIESYTVLKGPEAAALYGIEAGNGAIVITTKKGKKGKGSITFSNNTRIEEIYRLPRAQRVYARGIEGMTLPNYRRHFGKAYAPETQLFDNVDNFFQTGVMQTTNLTFDGGNETATYRLSLGNLSQTGVIPNSAFERINLTLKGTLKINEKVRSEALFAYTKTSNRKASKGPGGFLANLLAFPADVNMLDYTNPDGSRRRVTDGSLDTEVDNPLWDVNKNPAEDFNNRMVGTVGVIYDPLSWLTATVRVGVDVNAGTGYRAVHPESQLGLGPGGFIESYFSNTSNINSNAFLTIKKSFGKFNSNINVGNAIDDRYRKTFSSSGNRFVDANFNSLNNTDPTTQRSQERIVRKRLIGFFGEATFDYNKIFYATLTGRRDWSSTLPRNDNSFPSYSLSGSFVLTEIAGLKDGKIISFAKLRASTARTGKDTDAYALDSFYNPVATTGGGYAYGVTGGNPMLQPEFLKSTEFGAEFKLFNNRIGFDIAAYRTRTDDPIIRNVRLSYGTGFILTSVNFGALQNEGLEMTLTASPWKTDNFEWSTVTNFTKTDSKLLSLPTNLPEFYMSDTWLLGNVRGGTRVGAPLTALTGFDYLRNNIGDVLIDPASGSPLRDQSFPIIADRNPDFVIGFQNTFRYKNLSLSCLLDIRKGGDVFNGNEYFMYSQGLSERTLDRETPRIISGVLRDGLENSAIPTANNIQITPYYQNGYYRFDGVESDFIERDINWLRMRDITLNYRLSKDLLQRTRFFKTVSFSLTMTDPFIITNYTGADPAVNGTNASTGGAGGTGFDFGALSTPRTFNIGISVGL